MHWSDPNQSPHPSYSPERVLPAPKQPISPPPWMDPALTALGLPIFPGYNEHYGVQNTHLIQSLPGFLSSPHADQPVIKIITRQVWIHWKWLRVLKNTTSLSLQEMRGLPHTWVLFWNQGEDMLFPASISTPKLKCHHKTHSHMQPAKQKYYKDERERERWGKKNKKDKLD